MTKLSSSVWGNGVWKTTSFKLVRNLARYNFPQKMDRGALSQVTPIMENALKSAVEGMESVEKLEGIEQEFLSEHFFRLGGFHNRGENQRFVLDQGGSFLGTLNMQDHLNVEVIDYEGKWDEAWNRFVMIKSGLEKELEFAYSPRFGFLTAEPGVCGTGLIVQVCLHVPALIYLHKLTVDDEMEAMGLTGSLEELPGDLILVRNRYTLGKDEREIVEGVKRCAERIVEMENEAREELKKNEDTQLKDKVSRAIGLLLHSFQIEVKEALSALSMVLLGMELGMVKGVERGKIEKCFMQCRRAHLLLSGEELEGDEVEQKRAVYLHRELEGLEA